MPVGAAFVFENRMTLLSGLFLTLGEYPPFKSKRPLIPVIP